MWYYFAEPLEAQMSDFLETLKLRLSDAQRRHQEATQGLQMAQAHHQMLTQEIFGWQKAVEAETRREAQENALSAMKERLVAANSAVHHPAPASATISLTPATQISAVATVEQGKSEINKTDVVREQLRQHATGMTPGEIWLAIQDQIGNRDYLYSVLKRLKDTNQVVERRGKYFLRESLSPVEVTH